MISNYCLNCKKFKIFAECQGRSVSCNNYDPVIKGRAGRNKENPKYVK